jgi:heme-degrading monooxygenase HmoA
MADSTPESGLPPLGPDGFPQPQSWLSVLQFFVKERAAEDFERDLESTYELATNQPGFISGHYARSKVDGRYIVISEWKTREDMKAWEDYEEHKGIMDEHESSYQPGRGAQNRKFIPWQRPGTEPKQWTP